MALAELIRRRADKELESFCRRRTLNYPKDKVHLSNEFRGNAVTLIEERIPWHPALQRQPWTRMPIAQFRYDFGNATWTLYWSDRNIRWHVDDDIEPAAELTKLLGEVDRDPVRIYWG